MEDKENVVGQEPDGQTLDVEQALSQENRDITDWASYMQNVKGVSAQTRQDLEKLSELLKEAPKIGKQLLVQKQADAKNAIDRTVKETKGKFLAAMTSLKNRALTEVGKVKQSVQDYQQSVRDGMGEITTDEISADMGIGARAGIEEKLDEQWEQDKKDQGRSESVINTVQNTKKASRDIRAQMASGAVKVAGFVGKGLVLFGKKGLAKEMVENVGRHGQNFVGKESRIGKIMQRGAEFGFRTADGVRTGVGKVKETATNVKDGVVQFGNDVVELGGDIKKGVVQFGRDVKEDVVQLGHDVKEDVMQFGRDVKQGAKDLGEDVVEAGKRGAIAVGKATYMTVGVAAGIGSYVIDSVGDAAKKHIITPGKEVVGNAAKTADATKTFGSSFLVAAKAKFDKVKSIKSFNLRTRVGNLLHSVGDRVTPTLEDREAVNASKAQYEIAINELQGAGENVVEAAKNTINSVTGNKKTQTPQIKGASGDMAR